jgi:hypothetical protein
MIMFAEDNIPSAATTNVPSTVPSLSDFRKNFNCFSSNALLELKWSNVIAAGGCCTACLLPVCKGTVRASWFDPELPWEHRQHSKNIAQKGSYVNDLYSKEDVAKYGKRSKSHKSRDIDLFLYNLNAEQAKEKIKEIHEVISDASRRPPLVVVNGHAVTFYREFPLRSIQVVTRLYKSPSEILLGFDLDSCCVGFDGKKVLCAPRTIRAFNTRCNVVDKSRRSLTYESRLYKYAKRNFAVVVPDIERSEINPSTFDLLTLTGKPYSIKGFEKLLMHELSFRDIRMPTCECLALLHGSKQREEQSLHAVEHWWYYSNSTFRNCFNKKCAEARKDSSQDESCGQPVSLRDLTVHNKRTSSWGSVGPDVLYSVAGPRGNDDVKLLAAQMRGTGQLPMNYHNTAVKSDYEYVSLPWKRGISMEHCYESLRTYMTRHQNSVDWKEEIALEDEDGWSPEWLEDVDPNAPVLWFDFDVAKYLHRIQFIEIDAGRQLLTGSFHPISDDNWFDNVKLNVGTHKRFQIVLDSIDYPENVTSEQKLASSKVVRQAMCDIFPNPEDLLWLMKDSRQYENGTHTNNPPHWWQGGVLLASAATAEQVEHFKLALAVATPPPFEKVSFNEYEILVGGESNRKVSLALAMAQPALNRCGHCSVELLVPNRCRGCKLISFCNKECQQKGWRKHRQVCKAGKKKKKRK